MRKMFLLPALLAVAFLAACDAAPAATPTAEPPAATPTAPADTPAPATPTPEPPATPAVTPETPTTTPAPGTGLTGTECEGIPSFMDADAADFEFSRDEALEAMFPSSVQGAPVEELSSFRWIEFVCMYAGQEALEAVLAESPSTSMLDVTAMTMAMAQVQPGGEFVTIAAVRMAGINMSAAAQIEMLAALAAGEGMPGEANLEQATVGGKSVYVASDDEQVSYMYPVNDVLFLLADVDEPTAAAVLAELP